MESILGRYLLAEEVVDHIDGNTLNNDPKNLRLFPSNAEHLRVTLKGKVPQWSEEGIAAIHRLRPPGVDTHGQRRKSGELKKSRILRARELLGKDHLSSSGMASTHLSKGEIVPEEIGTESGN